jgi:2-iminobutanoate/2-iminopropanoate deaminase
MAEESRSWQPVSLEADVPPPAGAYSPAVRAGDLLFVSGQVPRDPRTGQTVGNDVETQTRQVIQNLSAVLSAAGATLEDVVSVTAYLADPWLWARFNSTYRELMPPPYPARTAVGCSLTGFLVEISAIAHVGRRAEE